MEFQLSYFQSWKMMLWKYCIQYANKFGKLSSGHRTGKCQFSSQSQWKAIPKNVQTTTLLHSSHTLEKQCSKFSKPGFNTTWTVNFQMFVGFRKGRGTRDQITNVHWIIEKVIEFQKTFISVLLTAPKPLIVWITKIYGKFFKRWDYQTTLPASWEICMQVRKQH